MGRISFTDEVSPAFNRGDSFPKLKLKTGDKARVCVLETPYEAFVHQLVEPVILDGKGVMEVRKRKDQSTYEDWKDKFVASFQCLGDEETLFQQGVDVKNCPACEASTQFDRFRGPQPKYALNIIKYNTKAGSSEVQKPFGVSAEVWVFGAAKYAELRALVKEGNYDLKKHDLILGPCEHETYQKFNIMISQTAEWLADDARKSQTMETFKENRIEDNDLSKAIAQVKDRAQVESLVNRVKRNWDIVNGVAISNTDQILAQAGSSNETPTLDNSTPAPTPSLDDAAGESLSFEDLIGDLTDL
jgi:hypothetical protein